MNQKKEFLTEENYEQGKKKLKTIIIVILTVGLLLGGGLIITGIIKTNNAKADIAETESKRTESDVQAEIDEIDTKITNIETEINNLNLEKKRLSNEQSKIFQEDRGFSDRYYAKDEEIEIKKQEITAKENEKRKLESSKTDLETELWKMQSGFNDTKNKISTSKYVSFYMFGGFIIVATCMISFFLFTILKRREIAAFTVQQTMPLAQEGIEKMSPTIGNAVETIGKDVAKGIKEGINEADSNKK